VLKKVRSNKVKLQSRVSGHGVEVEFDGFVNVGLWQPKNAPFLAIEPWMGISDEVGFVGDLPVKTDIVRLNTGAGRVFTHKISLF
jgi:galactose mutarotase-like enzyme